LAADQAVATAPGRSDTRSGWLLALVVACLVGVAATVTQIVERIQIAADPEASLICDLNATFSCGSVITAWQSSVIGPIPNAVIGLVVFTALGTSAATALVGTWWSRRAWTGLTGLAGVMLVFTVWFLAQTAFVIQRVCLWCLVIGAAILLANVALWRLGHRDGHLDGSSPLARGASWLIRGGSDLVLWAGLAALVVLMLVAGLA
jgi:uncharacterized membrane protein